MNMESKMNQSFFASWVFVAAAVLAMPANATNAEQLTAEMVDETGLDADTINDLTFAGMAEIQAQLESFETLVELDQRVIAETLEMLPFVAAESAQFALASMADIEPLLVAQLEMSEADREQLEREMDAASQDMERAREDMHRAKTDLESNEADRQREFEDARAEMEEAAHEMARIGQEIAQDYVIQFGDMHRKAMLGINLGEEIEVGVEVAAVTPDGPADVAGVMAGDVVVSIDGQMLNEGDNSLRTINLIEYMTEVEPDQQVTVGLDRDGVHHDVVVTAAENDFRRFRFNFEFPGAEDFDGGEYTFVMPDDWAEDYAEGGGRVRPGRYFPLFKRPAIAGWDAMELVTLTPALGRYFGTEEGLLVVRAPDSDVLQLEDGDVILKIDGRTPDSPGHALRILASYQNGDQLEIEIMREQRPVKLDVSFPDQPGDAKTSLRTTPDIHSALGRPIKTYLYAMYQTL